MFSWYDLSSNTVATNALSVTGIVACITSIFQLFFQKKWSSQGSGEVELFHHVSLMTLDSILKCAHSYVSNCQTQE